MYIVYKFSAKKKAKKQNKNHTEKYILLREMLYVARICTFVRLLCVENRGEESTYKPRW